MKRKQFVRPDPRRWMTHKSHRSFSGYILVCFNENPVVAVKQGTLHLNVNINATSGLPCCCRTTEYPRKGICMKQAAREANNAGESISMALNRLRQRSATKERPNCPELHVHSCPGSPKPSVWCDRGLPSRKTAKPQ